MFNNKKEIFSIRKFKDGRSDSVKIGALALLFGAALSTSTVSALENTSGSTDTGRPSSAMPRPANEGQPITQGTGFRNAQNVSISVNSEKDVLNAGEQTVLRTDINIGGTDVTYDNVYLEIEGQDKVLIELNISAFNNKQAIVRSMSNDKDGSENSIYKLDLGNVVSGTKISIPFTYNAPSEYNTPYGSNEAKFIVRLKDSNNNIIKESTETVRYNIPEIKDVPIQIIQSSEGTISNKPIIAKLENNLVSKGAILEFNFKEIKSSSLGYEISWDPTLYEYVDSENAKEISSNSIYFEEANSNYTFLLKYIGKKALNVTEGLKVQRVSKVFKNVPEKPIKNINLDVISSNVTNEIKSINNSSLEFSQKIGSKKKEKYNDNRTNLSTDTRSEMNVLEVSPGLGIGYNQKLEISSSEDYKIDTVRNLKISTPFDASDNSKDLNSSFEFLALNSQYFDSPDEMSKIKIFINKNDGSKIELKKMDIKNYESIYGVYDVRYSSDEKVESKDVKNVEIDFGKDIPLFQNKILVNVQYSEDFKEFKHLLSDYPENKEFIVNEPIKNNTFVYDYYVNDKKYYSSYAIIKHLNQDLGVQLLGSKSTALIGEKLNKFSFLNLTGKLGNFILTQNENKLIIKVPNGIIISKDRTGHSQELKIVKSYKENDLTVYEIEGNNVKSTNDVKTFLRFYSDFSFEVTPEISSIANGRTEFEFPIKFGAIANTPSYYSVLMEDKFDFDKDNNKNEKSNPGKQVAVSDEMFYRVAVPKSLYLSDSSKSQTGGKLQDTYNVSAGETVTIYPKAINTTEDAYRDMTVITVIPSLNDKLFAGGSRGSQFSPKLTGPVTPPAGWTVQYTTAQQTGNAKDLTGWVNSVDDYSKVTAIKWISNPGTVLSPNNNAEFSYDLKIPQDVRGGSKITTTSAIAVNGLNTFMEGFRSTVTVKETYGSVKVKYEDETGKEIQTAKEVKPANTASGTPYTLDAALKPNVLNANNQQYTFLKLKDGSAPENGNVKEGEQVITLVYSSAKESTRTTTGTVKVQFVDETGKVIKEVIDTDKAVVETIKEKTFADGRKEVISSTPSNATYDATEHKTNTVSKDNTTYHLLKVKDNNISGKLTAGETIVTFVYGKETSRTTNGTVKVKFVDETGKALKEVVDSNNVVVENIKEKTLENGSKEVISATPTNATYDVNEHKQDVIEVDGVKYQIKEVQGDLTGKVKTGETVVTFTYTKVEKSNTPKEGVPYPTVDLPALPMNELFNPEGGETIVNKGDNLPDEDIIKLVTGIPENREGVEIKIISEKPSTDVPGVYDVEIEITYPDGTKDKTTVKVTVVEKSNIPKEGVPFPTFDLPSIPMNELFNPSGKLVEGNKGIPLTNDEIIEKITGIPNNPGVTFKVIEKPSTDKPGEFETTVEITYPDGTKDIIKLPVLIKDTPPTVSLNPMEVSNLYNPEGGKITVDKGTPLSNEDIFKQITGTPKNKDDYEFKLIEKPSTDNPGVFDATIEIVYPDGSKDTVTVKVTVVEKSNTPKEGVPFPTVNKPALPMNELFNPEGGSKTIDKGTPLSEEDLIKLISGLPEDKNNYTTKVIGKVPTDQPGVYEVEIEITYPDGTKDKTTVKVTVVEKSNTPKEGVPYPTVDLPALPMNELFNPEGGETIVNKGDNLPDEDLINLVTGIPENREGVEIKIISEKPSTDNPGTYEVEIEITYPDGTKDKTTVKVTVVEKSNTPKEGVPYPTVELPAIPISEIVNPKGGQITVELGGSYTEEDLFKTIKGIPENVKADFKVISEKPSTDKPGTYDVTVEITYEDGSKETVITQVIVKDKPKAIETPKQPAQTVVKETPKAVEAKETPDTGAATSIFGLISSITGLSLLGAIKKKKED